MEKLLGTLSEHFGYAAPVMYAAAAYGLFHWLDENASDEAKASLAQTMRLKDFKSEQVASALVEVFDRIYSYPLFRWRAFRRSLLFTTVVSVIFVFETGTWHDFLRVTPEGAFLWWLDFLYEMLAALMFNVFTDYLSLFVIRPVLIRSGTKPVIALALGAASGIAIVWAANVARYLFLVVYVCAFSDLTSRELNDLSPMLAEGSRGLPSCFLFELSRFSAPSSFGQLFWTWPGLIVFAWLPLFALGIVAARLLTPMSWVVGRVQWFLKEGKAHPLKAIGYVATVVVFLGTVAARAVFST